MFSDPVTNVPYFGLTEGTRVADFGTGSGAYALAMAKQVGSSGIVYAVDVQKDLLERLAREAKAESVHNLKVLWGDVDKLGGSKLADGAVDVVLLANLLFQSDQKYTMVLEAKRILRAGGRAIVVEWSGAFGGLGPSPERVLSPVETKKILAQAGFTFVSEFPAGAQHYGLIFVKNP